jgi:hypothetical protein
LTYWCPHMKMLYFKSFSGKMKLLSKKHQSEYHNFIIGNTQLAIFNLANRRTLTYCCTNMNVLNLYKLSLLSKTTSNIIP